MSAKTAAVIIGRNEGIRLHRCIESALPFFDAVVYVDSGSTDQSVDYASSKGCNVVDLDISDGFSAARARNAGFEQLRLVLPELEYVQFIDGDCELQPNWPLAARTFLDQNPSTAIVCGRRRERFPEASIFNQLCDWEWSIPPGEILYCGGDILARADALIEVDGYLDTLIAGEEPELCVRLRRKGWKIHCIDEEMTLHDAAITKFRQWWQRAKRSGYAYAAGTWLHGCSNERMWIWECARIWIWTVLVPIMMLTACLFVGWWGLFLGAAYPLQSIRSFLNDTAMKEGRATRAFFNTLSKLPEFVGQLSFLKSISSDSFQLIEYK